MISEPALAAAQIALGVENFQPPKKEKKTARPQVAREAARHDCSSCKVPMVRDRVLGKNLPVDYCPSCRLIWCPSASLNQFFDDIANPEVAEEPKPSIIPAVAVFGVGFPLVLYGTYYFLESFFQAVLFSCTFGLFGLYVTFLAVQGKIINWGGIQSGSEGHADIEEVGSVTADILQDLKPWLIAFVVLLTLTGGLFMSSKKVRAHVVKLMASMQQPPADAISESRHPERTAKRAAKACDTYFLARSIDATIFNYDEVRDIQNLCRAVGTDEYAQKASRFLKRSY